MPRLTHTTCNSIKTIGMHSDGNGLYLKVQSSRKSSNGVTKSWLIRWGAGGCHSMGLGNFPEVALLRARELALEVKRQIAEGLDPIEERDKLKADKSTKHLTLTFQEAAEHYIETHKSSWRNAKHASQWANTLRTYAHPYIGSKSVQDIEVEDLRSLLSQIWTTKSTTATRLRGRIESVLNFATVAGYRTNRFNPATWRGNLEHLLSKINKRKTVKHFAALPYKDAPTLYQSLKHLDLISARALQFTILTATRTGMVIGADWKEIDFENKVWIVPAERTKAHIQHRVPLSDEAFRIISELNELKVNNWIFPSPRGHNKHISNMAMLQLVKRDYNDYKITVHGFRSTFREWTGELTNHQREVLEHALSHQLQDQVEAAYARGDQMQKRRAAMQDWANFCLSLPQI